MARDASSTRDGTMAESEFDNLHEIVKKARQNLDQNNWDYIVGATETETTLRRNRLSIDSVAFRPRVLRDVSKVDPSVTRFGRKLRLPVMLAPVGSLESFVPDGAASCVRAAKEFGIAHMLSSVCMPGLEAVADQAPDALRIFQLYVRGDDTFVEDHVKRAIDKGYAAFCLTVDTAHYSRRERDLAKRHTTAGRARASGREFQAALDWRTVKWIKDKYKIPLILKGIATAEDAKMAIDHGVEWVYVSNHGGRQLDHGLGSFEVLPEIVDAVAGRAKIMVDGGFYRGTDIVKALAAGADIVGLGRMQCYGLGAAGQAGVVRMLELMEDEVKRCLGLLGVNGFGEIDRSYLRPAAPTVQSHVLSAFPLLEVDRWRYY
ncbi:MAG: alpha-hydroxy-acid oxidizing protein [Alphaproteobacteria bacterium]|nr:alpha-hydroxy-acid oxidizing protein [Alphaproteobacteria bacterium]